MTVNPGWGGQPFIEHSLDKLERLRAVVGHDLPIEVDGGIDAGTARRCAEAGATVFVAGSAVFGAPDPAAVVPTFVPHKKSTQPWYRPKDTRLKRLKLTWLPGISNAGRLVRTMFNWISCTAGFVTRTSIRSKTTGFPASSRWCPATRSWAG